MILIFGFLLKRKGNFSDRLMMDECVFFFDSHFDEWATSQTYYIPHSTALPSLTVGHTQLSPRQSSAREPVLASWPICSFVERKKRKLKKKTPFFFLSFILDEKRRGRNCSTLYKHPAYRETGPPQRWIESSLTIVVLPQRDDGLSMARRCM